MFPHAKESGMYVPDSPFIKSKGHAAWRPSGEFSKGEAAA
jgi:hypothetical protein